MYLNKIYVVKLNHLTLVLPCLDAVLNLNRTEPVRPKYEIQREHLLYFKLLGFIWNAIVDMHLVSRITDLVGFSKISNDDFDNLIRDYRNTHGLACGRSMILGHLNSVGIKDQQKPVTKSLVCIDLDGFHMRWLLIAMEKNEIMFLLQTACGT